MDRGTSGAGVRTRRNLGGTAGAACSSRRAGTTGSVGVSGDGGLHCSLISVPDPQYEAESAFSKESVWTNEKT